MNSSSSFHLVPENTSAEPAHSRNERVVGPKPRAHSCPGNAPRTMWDYLMYPRVLLTAIICAVTTAMHIGFGLYMWLFAE
jgi:hypothetical protein